MAVAILGMRGSGGFTADERPKNFRQGILFLFPNGDTPLTAILSMLSEEATSDAQYNWFEKGLPVQRGRIIGASTTVGSKPADGADIAAADATAEIALTLQPDGGAEDDLSWLKPGHVLFNEQKEEAYGVINVVTTSGAERIIVRRDIGNKFASNPAVTGGAADGDFVTIIGSGFPEGAGIGSAVSYQPIKHFNFTQIFRTPLFVTRTARQTTMRWDSGGPYIEMQREALQLHAIEMERAFLFGEREEVVALTGSGGLPSELSAVGANQPMRFTRGVVNWLPAIDIAGNPDTVHHDIGTANLGSLTYLNFLAWAEQVFRHGSNEKLGLIGSTALNVITQMAMGKMQLTAVPTDQAFGMAIFRLVTPFGNLMLKQHPLMSVNPTWRKDLIAVDVDKLRYRFVLDTTYKKNRQNPGDDATKDEYITEAGLECQFSGATPDSSSGLPSIPGPAAHGRLKGIETFGG